LDTPSYNAEVNNGLELHLPSHIRFDGMMPSRDHFV